MSKQQTQHFRACDNTPRFPWPGLSFPETPDSGRCRCRWRAPARVRGPFREAQFRFGLGFSGPRQRSAALREVGNLWLLSSLGQGQREAATNIGQCELPETRSNPTSFERSEFHEVFFVCCFFGKYHGENWERGISDYFHTSIGVVLHVS